jgi:hypothetical protein
LDVFNYACDGYTNFRNTLYYTWEGETTQKLKGWNWWTMAMILRPHEAIEWR